MSGAQQKFYFYDPRLRMTFGGRFLVRVVGYVSYLFILAGVVTLFLGDSKWMFFGGVLLALFFIDYAFYSHRADRPLSEMSQKGEVNLAKFLRPEGFLIIERALDRSWFRGTSFLLEIMSQLLGRDEIKDGLVRMDIEPKELKQKLEIFLEESKESRAAEEFFVLSEELLIEAVRVALTSGHRFIEVSDLFSALTELNDEFLARLFGLFEVGKEDLRKALIFSSTAKGGMRRIPSSLGGFTFGIHRGMRHRVMNRAWTSRPTPILDKYSVDFTDLARRERVGFLIGHKAEYNKLLDALSKPVSPNALLIGEEGVGKETVIAHLAFQISKDRVPQPLFDKRLVMLQIGEVVAGASPEEVQARFIRIVDEIIKAGNIILYLPEFHDLVKTSGTAYLSVADSLMPIIKNNDFPIIGSSYPLEFKRDIETRSDIAGLFEVIPVNEITQEEAEELLVYKSLILEREFKAVISFGAVKKAVVLAKKYFTNKFLPSSADDLIKVALSEVKRRGEKVLKAEDIVMAAEQRINVPIHEVSQKEAEQLLNMEKIIHERLVDQEEAVEAVSNVLRAYRSGLSRSGKPIASFLFVGPTGVGKTELSKILAELMFGSKEAMVRFDMTEYQDKQSFYRFVGSPDGKISGMLTDAILKKPYSLILLDEFEKAYPDILDLFLQVFDDGRLTDNLGRTVNFQNTIIIATSNAHSDIINKALASGQTMSQIADYLKAKLSSVFKPELVNRFSRVVVFNSLSPEQVREVAALNLKEFTNQVAKQGIFLEFSSSAIKEIARLGYEPAFGARPISRVIEDKVKAPLASKLLSKEIKKGDKIVVLGKEGVFEFESEKKYEN